MRKLFVLTACILVFASVALAASGGGVKKKRPLPHEFGRVVINNYSERAGMAPVVFDHWVHRAQFTCRLCHVDLAFGMKAGATDIKAADNMKGFYCGACHNGKMVVNERKLFEACERQHKKEDGRRCDRCHSLGKTVARDTDFTAFAERLPRERLGNGIDWEKAEETGLIKPADFLAGVSIARKPMAIQKDFDLTSKVEGMPDIIFSHKKHTVWNGCELCHPDLFVGVKKGMTKYSMVDIFEGKYCGVCHTSVAFPLQDCQRCHTKAVQ